MYIGDSMSNRELNEFIFDNELLELLDSGYVLSLFDNYYELVNPLFPTKCVKTFRNNEVIKYILETYKNYGIYVLELPGCESGEYLVHTKSSIIELCQVADEDEEFDVREFKRMILRKREEQIKATGMHAATPVCEDDKCEELPQYVYVVGLGRDTHYSAYWDRKKAEYIAKKKNGWISTVELS